MKTSIDSAIWTGVTTLTELEQRGRLTYIENAVRLRRHRLVTAIAALAILAFATWQATQIREIALASRSGNPILFVVVLLLLVAGAAVTWLWLADRLARARDTAPLVIDTDKLRIGAASRSVSFSSIESLTPRAPRSINEWIAWMVYRPPFGFGLRSISLFELKLKNDATPLLLDLDLLDGDPYKIREILEYRIQQAKV